ncbi:polymorphic toxin-type HINT domain-containing protein [Streptomyces vinaceus]|uniref:polymorphic toxin-type HINT domain-containing protein n=1 Tax=Streptomyces vinaceus TaxID=1960 RepID=UPI0035DF9D49
MADGTTKEIQDVRVGDTVLATDPQTGETRPQQVTATITTPDDKDFTDLTLTDESNPRAPPVQLTSTYHHPHWNETRHQWVDAGEFIPGEQLRSPDGTTLTVQSKRNYPYAVTTHNLTVSDFHTYYVLAGSTPVLFTIAVPAARSLASHAPAVPIRALRGSEPARKAPGDFPPKRKRRKRTRSHSGTDCRCARLTVRLKVHL